MSRTLKCPICKKPVALEDPFMPFCSERCKLIDLGNWASERYVITTPLDSAEQATEEGAGENPSGDSPH
jgi:endogenous inhibitor of DNA gyrase (YacG/DUF329 family)